MQYGENLNEEAVLSTSTAVAKISVRAAAGLALNPRAPRLESREPRIF